MREECEFVNAECVHRWQNVLQSNVHIKFTHSIRGKIPIFNREAHSCRIVGKSFVMKQVRRLEVFWPTIRGGLDSCLRRNNGKEAF